MLQKGIKTNATQSIPSPVKNLCEVHNHVKLEKLLGAVGWEYLRTCPLTHQDMGKDHIGKQRGFQLVNPTDQWFPGMLINKLLENCRICYGSSAQLKLYGICLEIYLTQLNQTST